MMRGGSGEATFAFLRSVPLALALQCSLHRAKLDLVSRNLLCEFFFGAAHRLNGHWSALANQISLRRYNLLLNYLSKPSKL